MKTFYLALLVGVLAIPVFAQTNQTALEQATATAKASISTNLNEVIVDILRGVKSAGSEVYAASKTAITKSVDFTMEQAPLVVKEFLHWQIAKAGMWILIFGTVSMSLFWFARQLKKYSEQSHYNSGDASAGKWVLRVVALILLIVTVGVNGMTIAKVIVAPRVFLIEYVVDALNPNPHYRR